jgi:hypothetical protein
MQYTTWARHRKSPRDFGPLECFAGEGIFFEEFGLQFANEAGTGGIDDLKFFCDEEDRS